MKLNNNDDIDSDELSVSESERSARARARGRVPNFILSSKLVQPSWHVFVELLVIKFSMLIRGTAVRLRQPEQNTKIIEFKLP